MKELIEQIAKALVDSPDEVSVAAVEGEQTTVLELRVAPSDLGKVIGKQGRTARSIRTILGAAGMKLKKRGKPVGETGRRLLTRSPAPKGIDWPCEARKERARRERAASDGAARRA
jgi:hypothetical protein